MTTRLAKLWFRQACVLTLVMVGVLLVVVLFAPDNASSMTGPTLSVTGSGVDGTETLEVKVNGLSEGSLTFGTNLSSQSIVLSADTEWEDIELSFADGPGKDLTVSSFSLDADQRFVVPGDVLISGQWTGTTCSALGPPIGETIHCSGVIQFPAAVDGPAPIGDLDPSYWGNAQTVVPVYDTAWDMGVQVTLEQGEEYMDFLVDAGFSGFATTYLGNIHAPAQPPGGNFYVTKDGIGNSIASWDDATGHLDMDPAHADHFEDILDAAHARGLRVMLLVVWERKTVEQYGLLNEGNVYDWGFQLGTRFANHPAIQAWTLGGDAGTDEPRTQFWTNVSNGLRDAGVTGDMNFHTGSSTARRVNQIDAPWNTGQLVMTSHCADTALATSRLNTVMAQADIHVWAGEPRYEGIYPTWCPDPYVPTAQDIVDDALSFVDAGVAGVFYGHNERWQWGHGLEGSDGRGWQGVQDSFNAPGAFALIEALTEYQPPTGPPPNVVINEIHYHPADGGVEFVELYNAEDETVDISGWDLDGMMTFAAGTEIPADGYLVATADVALFQSAFPGVVAVQWEAGSDLENAGEAVSLKTNAMVLVDEVSYSNEAPWPIEPNGNGPSLELIDPGFDNGAGSSWESSLTVGGSPGLANGQLLCGGLAITVDLGLGQLPTNGDDVILGTSAADVINGLAGNDTICGLGGDDTINGGNGVDVIFGDGGADRISGQGGDDVLSGGAGDDLMNGGVGDDTLYGGPGDDDLRGQGQHDVLFGGGGVDQFFGGSGNDVIHTGEGGNAGTTQLVRGQSNNDVIHGSPDADVLEGGPGLDEIFGGDGDDLLKGALGSDTLHGEGGADRLEGGATRDFLYGGDGADELLGGLGDDELFGQNGDDSLSGQGDTDSCDGGAGVDTATATCETWVDVP